MASGALRELIALFTVEVDPEGNLEKGDKKVEGFLGTLKNATKVAAELFAIREIKEFVDGTIEAGARLFDLSSRLGLATQDLQAFQFMGKLVGVEGEQMAMILGHLNRSVGEVATGLGGGEVAKAFAALKISVKDARGEVKPMPELLGDVAEELSGIPEASKRAVYAQQIFGRQGQALLPLLSQGREGLAKMREEFEDLGGGMSEDFVKRAKEVDDETQKLSLGWTSLKTIIVSELLPPIRKIVDWFIRMTKGAIQLNKETNILSTGMMFLGAFAALKMVTGLREVLGVLGVLRPGLLQTVAALWEFAAPAIIVIGLYLAFVELFTLMKGGKTVLGEVLDGLFGLGTGAAFAQELSDEWDRFNSVLETTGDVLGDLATIVVNVLETAFHRVFGTITGVGSALSKLAHGDFAGAGAAIQGALSQGPDAEEVARQDAIIGAGRDIGTNVSGRRKGSFNANDPNRVPGAWWDQGAGQTTVGPITTAHVREPTGMSFGHLPAGGRGGGGIHQHNETHVVVHTTSTEPRKVGDAVGQGVSTAQERANANALASTKRT